MIRRCSGVSFLFLYFSSRKLAGGRCDDRISLFMLVVAGRKPAAVPRPKEGRKKQTAVSRNRRCTNVNAGIADMLLLRLAFVAMSNASDHLLLFFQSVSARRICERLPVTKLSRKTNRSLS